MNSGTAENWLERHAPVKSEASLPEGGRVGRWEVVAFVARGGSSEVYRVRDASGLFAALKILHRTDDRTRARFEREISSLFSLHNPGFPAFYEAGEFDGRPWCAMEFLQPLDLPTRDRAVARLVLSVCKSVGILHARGFVHRDIKPANVMSRGGAPVLIDLGLLKESETPVLHAGQTVSVVDGHRVGVGTPGYSAPEQFTGGEISPVADIHAIGVLASTCFAGRPPRVWRQIIRRATSSLPSERFPDVAALARAVRLRHLPAFLVSAAAVAVAAAVALPAMESRNNPDVPSPPAAPAASSPSLPEAFRAVLGGGVDRVWIDDFRAELSAVDKAAETPDAVPDSLVSRLVFEPVNGICSIPRGSVGVQISSYNRRYPGNAKRMPQPSDFAPLVSDMLRRRSVGGSLSRDEYLAFRRRFFDIAGMELRTVFNRLVIAVFPSQFVTPADEKRTSDCLRTLVSRGFVPPAAHAPKDVAWFEESSHMAREVTAALYGSGPVDPALVSYFVWYVGGGSGAQPADNVPPPGAAEVRGHNVPADFSTALGDGEIEWTTSEKAPWTCREGDSYSGFAAAVGSAVEGEVSTLGGTVVGPARVEFHFRRQSHAVGFQVRVESAADDGSPDVFVPEEFETDDWRRVASSVALDDWRRTFSAPVALDDFNPGEWRTSAIFAHAGTNRVVFSVFPASGAPKSTAVSDHFVEIDSVEVVRGDLAEEHAEAFFDEAVDDIRRTYLDEAKDKVGAALTRFENLEERFGTPYAIYRAMSLFYEAILLDENSPGRTNTPASLRVLDECLSILRKLAKTNDGPFANVIGQVLEMQNEMRRSLDMPLTEEGARYEERLRKKAAELPERRLKSLAELEADMVPVPGRGFAICRSETAQRLWDAFMDFNPSPSRGPDLPVSNVGIDHVEAFVSRLNAMPEVADTGREFRLPTAEEWEFACLAGGTNGFCRLADGTQITEETLGEVAWGASNSGGVPHPVCGRKPNAFGLYDMHGNVAEFTSTAPSLGLLIWKGNCYNGDAPAKFRADFSPAIGLWQRFPICGFRLARDLPGREPAAR